VGKDSSSFSTGNNQDGEYESTADGLSAEFDSELVCACALTGSMLMLRKRANSNDVSVLIKTAPLKLCSDCYTLVRGKFTIISSLVC
jgi:hypothetical protein